MIAWYLLLCLLQAIPENTTNNQGGSKLVLPQPLESNSIQWTLLEDHLTNSLEHCGLDFCVHGEFFVFAWWLWFLVAFAL